MALPAPPLGDRIHEVAREARRAMFQDWTLEICYLFDGQPNLRYGQPRKLLPNIGTRTLAETLRPLQRVGILRRTSYDEIPPRVEYALTDVGRRFARLALPVLVQAARAANPQLNWPDMYVPCDPNTATSSSPTGSRQTAKPFYECSWSEMSG